jgi:hypothetical protein
MTTEPKSKTTHLRLNRQERGWIVKRIDKSPVVNLTRMTAWKPFLFDKDFTEMLRERNCSASVGNGIFGCYFKL